MNTPKPCDTCDHLYYNCMKEDDPLDAAICKLDHKMGNMSCWYHSKYKNDPWHNPENVKILTVASLIGLVLLIIGCIVIG